MLAPLLVTLWLVSLVIGGVWLGRMALRLVLAVGLLTNALGRDLMSEGVARLRWRDSPCA